MDRIVPSEGESRLPNRNSDFLLAGLDVHQISGRLPLKAGDQASQVNPSAVECFNESLGSMERKPDAHSFIGSFDVHIEGVGALKDPDMLVGFANFHEIGIGK